MTAPVAELPLAVGASKITALRVGATAADALYVGSTQLYRIKTHQLTESFDALDLAKWNPVTGPTISVQGGQLVIPMHSGYETLRSRAETDFTGSSVAIEIVSRWDPTTDESKYNDIALLLVKPNPTGTGSSQGLSIDVISDSLNYYIKRPGASGWTFYPGTTWYPDSRRFLRIRHQPPSTACFEYSGNGRDYTTFATQDISTMDLTRLQIRISSGSDHTPGSPAPQPTIFDNLSLGPRTVAYRGDTAAATLPVDSALTAGNITAGAGAAIVVPRAPDPGYDPNKIWSAAPPASTTNLAAAITNNCYFEVTLSRTGGMTLQALRLKGARAGSSTPRGFAIRSSVDGYVADLIAADIATVAPTLTQYSADISALGKRTSVTFRVFYYSPGTGSILHFDDLEVDYI